MANEKGLAEELMEMIKLSSGKSYKEILYFFAIESARISNADRVCLIILNLKKQLIIKAGFPPDAHTVNQIIIPEFGEQFLRQTMEYRKYVWINNPSSDTRTSYMKELAKYKNITSILFVPLYDKNESLGLLVFDFVNGKKISKDNVRRILNLADLMSMTMAVEYEKRKEKEKLRHEERMSALGINAARVAHRIRNALMNIGAFPVKIQKVTKRILAKELELDKALALIDEYASIVITREKELENIIKDVLAFSSLPKLSRDWHNLNDFLREEMGKLLTINQNYCMRCKFDFDKRLDYVKVSCDKEKILDCLRDIIINAREADAGFLSLRTRLKIKKNKVVILISNNGRKIDSMVGNEEIFEPFVTTKTNGIGLGLSNARMIMEAHNGGIKLIPQSLQTTFKIWFPFKIKT